MNDPSLSLYSEEGVITFILKKHVHGTFFTTIHLSGIYQKVSFLDFDSDFDLDIALDFYIFGNGMPDIFG